MEEEFEEFTPDLESGSDTISDDDGMFDLDFGDEPVEDVVEDVVEETTPSEVIETKLDEEEADETEDVEEPTEDVEASEESEDDDEEIFTPFVNLLLDKGVLALDPEKEYDDSEEGFAEIIEDTLKIKEQERLAKLSPQAQRLLEIEEKGGDIKEAFEELYSFDYKEVDLSDETIKEQIVRDHFIAQGYEEGEELDEMVEGLKDINKIDKAAEKAKAYFVKQQEAEREEYVSNLDAKNAQAEQERQETMNEVLRTIDTVEKLGVFNDIPKTEREAFKKYLFEKGEDGKTQSQRDNSMEAILINEFNKFKKFDYSVIDNRAKTKATIDWRKKAQRVADKQQSVSSASSRRYTKPDDGSFGLGDLE